MARNCGHIREVAFGERVYIFIVHVVAKIGRVTFVESGQSERNHCMSIDLPTESNSYDNMYHAA